MVDQYISSQHVEKLGHKIQEIRERALFNIISKLDNGVLFDNDLARSKDLYKYLCKWFLFEPCSQEEVVFSLLKRILKSESGKVLISHIGKCIIQKELQRIRSYLDPGYHPHLEELLQIVESQETDCVVPPLVSDLPLSYRSDGNTYDIGSTATSIKGFVKKDSSFEPQTGPDSATVRLESLNSQANTRTNSRSQHQVFRAYQNNMPNYTFQLQLLIEPDRHVLQSIEQSLADLSHPSALLHSCQFFNTVLIHDFPPEIFLQRPKIIWEFYSLLNCGSTRITNAVLNCLYDLTKAMHLRILHENDVSMRNNKTKHLAHSRLPLISPTSTPSEDDENTSNQDKFDTGEEVELLEKNQLPTPKYCLLTACCILKFLLPKSKDNVKVNQVSVNLCLVLLEELLGVLPLTIKIEIWDRPQTERTLKVLRDFNEMLVKYGEVLEYFRLEALMSETDLTARAIYLYLVHNCAKTLKSMVPLDKTGFILPNNIKIALSNCLLDVTLSRLYPALHEIILEYVKSLSQTNMDHLRKYEDMKSICNGMSAAMKFIANASGLGINDCLMTIYQSLPSLEFIIGDLGYINNVVNFLSEKLPEVSENSRKLEMAEKIILGLLAYNMEAIKEETYLVIHRKVLSSIGPKFDMAHNGVAGAQILFLLSSKIMVEIAAFGLNSENEEIRRYSENILNYILKCKILVCETIWDKVIQSIVPALPIIACFAGRKSPLGKSVVGLMDPDTSKDILMPQTLMLKTNIQFLFLEDASLRDEAFSRLCWLLSLQDNCRDFLPKLNMLYDNSIASVCLPKTPTDVNKVRRGNNHFYQPSSLEQVLVVLRSSDVEPSIRRSALNQISVMMEDVLLHRVFLNVNGLETIIPILETALTEKNYIDYPDSVIPIISILKNLCFHQATVRDELSNNVEVFYWILRGLFLFFTEEQMKQDASSLLFLLIFKDFFQGDPSRGDFSLPLVVMEKIKVPFQCANHWKNSPNMKESLKETIVSDRWCLTSLQIQWNAELLGGFQELVQKEEIDYSRIDCADILKINPYDLRRVKTSSVQYCVKHYLNEIENSTSHASVVDSIDLLTLYFHFYKISKVFEAHDNEEFTKLAWQRCFTRFLRSLPSCQDDLVLLNEVLVFLNILVTVYSKNCWVTNFLKENQHSLLDLISVDNSLDEDNKIVGQSLLKLLTTCVRKEQRFLEYYPPGEQTEKLLSWGQVVKVIICNLKSSGAENFYNLAYLDSLLACMVHLSAKLGWSSSISDIKPLVLCLRELLDAFHKGKGASASFSVMGLSITRHSILILNHLLAELQHAKFKNWEHCFLDDEYSQAINNLMDLWNNRDVVVRAAALQLVTGMIISPRIAARLTEEVEDLFYQRVITIMLDSEEASVVKENAAQLLANLAGMSAPLGIERPLPTNVAVLKKSFTLKLFSLLDENNFFENLESIIESLFTLNLHDVGKPFDRIRMIRDSSSCTSSSSNSEKFSLATTPGFIKAVVNLVHNISVLDIDNVSRRLQEMGLVKLIFRALCNPSMDVTHTTELMLYCDIMEMNISVCSLLVKLAGSNTVCLGTILHTKDCLSLLMSLLNPNTYNTDFPQLVYLKNKLWTEIFNLISTLLEYSPPMDGNQTFKSTEASLILSTTIFDTGSSTFLETLCESLSSLASTDLQTSALTSFTCLTRTEIFRLYQENATNDEYSGRYIKDLLDFTRSPKSVVIQDSKENRKPREAKKKHQTKKYSDKYRMNLLEEAYFGKILPVQKQTESDLEITFVDDDEAALMSGAEICKILLYLYDICDLSEEKASRSIKKKHLVISAMSGLLCISIEAKRHALQSGLLELVIKQLRANHVRLSLESGDCFRKIADKRKLKCCPLLKETVDLVSLLNNFMLDEGTVKEEAAGLYLADVIHKFWVWFQLQNIHLVDVLKMLCTFTTDCNLASQSLPLTSSCAGAGPRKTPSNGSLLHAIINLIIKEMEQISKTHDLITLELSFNILQNCCHSLECRVLMSKSNLFHSITRLHPASTKRQKPWENIELIWLKFLDTFTSHPEGQTCVAKITDVLELILAMTTSSKIQNRELALLVLRNLAFYQPNKPRLLASADFLCTLKSKLSNGTNKERMTVTVIIWSLVANCQKAKVLLKSAHLDVQLQNTIRQSQLLGGTSVSFKREELDRMCYVLSILRDNEKSK